MLVTVAVCLSRCCDSGSLSKLVLVAVAVCRRWVVLVTVAVCHRRNKSVEGGVGDCGSLSKLVLVTVAVCRSWCW